MHRLSVAGGRASEFPTDERAPHNDEKEEAPRTKAQLVALLKESAVVHGNEVYGSMAVYLKGIVSPSTERQTSAKPGH